MAAPSALSLAAAPPGRSVLVRPACHALAAARPLKAGATLEYGREVGMWVGGVGGRWTGGDLGYAGGDAGWGEGCGRRGRAASGGGVPRVEGEGCREQES